MKATMRCLAVVALACIATASAQVQLNPNVKMPTRFKSYAEYLKYVGMATGVLPVEPEADTAAALAPGAALAPVTALEARGGPEMMEQPNPNPTIQDWVDAYKPVDDQLNYIFEHRINKDNARAAQFQLAIAAAPLQMLVNAVTNEQAKSIAGTFSSFAKSIVGGANPLTGTSTTATVPTSGAATTTDGNTVTTSATAAASSTDAATAAGPAAGAAAAGTAAQPAATQTAAAANPFAGLASIFGRKLLKH